MRPPTTAPHHFEVIYEVDGASENDSRTYRDLYDALPVAKDRVVASARPAYVVCYQAADARGAPILDEGEVADAKIVAEWEVRPKEVERRHRGRHRRSSLTLDPDGDRASSSKGLP